MGEQNPLPPAEQSSGRAPAQPMGSRRGELFAAFFFLAFGFLLYQLYTVFSPFLAPIIWAAILALVFDPTYRFTLRRLGGRATLASLVLTAAVTVLIVIPAFSLSSVIARQAVGIYERLAELVSSGAVSGLGERLRGSVLATLWESLPQYGVSVKLEDLVQKSAQAATNFLVGQVADVAKNVATFTLNFLIMLFTLFFFFRDGEGLVGALRELIPMEEENKAFVLSRFYETLAAVVQGITATALVQGTLAGLAFWALGIPFSALLGVATALFALLPVGGAAAVWLPCTIYLLASGAIAKSIALLIWGALVISTVDNILKPLIIGGRTRIPTLFLFFALLGGLKAYGVLGLFLGPALLGTVVAFISIYRERFATRPRQG